METKKIFAIMMLTLLLFVAIMPITAFANPDDTNALDDVQIDKNGNVILQGEFAKNKDGASGAWNEFIKKYRLAISGLSGVASVTFLVFFILNFMKLGASAGNTMKRSEAITGLVWTGIACAGLGGVSIFIGFFYHALSSQ